MNLLIKSALILTVLTTLGLTTIEVKADPSIEWTYYPQTYQRGCWTECRKRFLGKCVATRQVCDFRTRYITSFNPSQKNVIQVAMNSLSQNIGNTNIRKCVQQFTTWYSGNYASKDHLVEQAWIDFDALRRANRWPHIDLHARRSLGVWDARAPVERKAWGTASKLSWNGNVSMEVNLDRIDEIVKQHGLESAADILAGTIFHELLHQMGHRHPDTGEYEVDYKQGHFVVVAGDCVQTNGEDARSPNGGGLDLTEPHPRWNLPN